MIIHHKCIFFCYYLVFTPLLLNIIYLHHLGGGPVVKAWDQDVCSLCGLRFEPCGCSYDGTGDLHGR